MVSQARSPAPFPSPPFFLPPARSPSSWGWNRTISHPWLPRGTPQSQALPSAQGRILPHYHPAAAPGKPSEKGQRWEQPHTGTGWGWMCPTRDTCCILGVRTPCQWLLLVAVLGRLTPAPAPKLLPLCSGVGGNPPGSSGGSCRHLGKGWPRCTQAPGGSRCQDAAISRLTSKSSWGLAREGSHTAHPARFRGRVLQGEHCYIKPRIQLEKQEAARRARLPPRRLLQRCASTPCPLLPAPPAERG